MLLPALLLPATRLEAWGGNGVLVGDYPVAGESFVFCLDRSCSMGWGPPLDEMKSLVSASLADLEPTQSFSLVMFGDSSTIYSTTLLPATAANVGQATTWLNAITPSGATAMGPALVQSISIAQQGVDPAIVVIADGAPNAPGPVDTFDMAAAANINNVPIHTVRLISVFDTLAINFLQALAAAHGGQWIDLTVPPPAAPFIRGDANDDGILNLADPILILQVGFGLAGPAICEAAHDANADGDVTAIADAITLLGFLFLDGFPPPAAPYPDCGLPLPLPVDPIPCEGGSCP